jgi:Mg2+/Co2+ transporter CorB
MIFLIIVIFAMILIAGFFAGSETGLTVASKAKLNQLANEEGSARAKKVLKLRRKKDTLISTLLLGNNFFNIGASMLAGTITASLVGASNLGILITTAVMTLLILIFGEIMPKIYAFNNADRVALWVAPIWVWIVLILSPITKIVNGVSILLLRILGYRGNPEIVDASEEIRDTIELHHEEGGVIKDDRDMLGSILDLSQIEVGEVMVHRRDMTTLNINDEPGHIIEKVIKTPHTRLPVWKDNEENIIGILHTKDILRLDRDNPGRNEIMALLKEPLFIPESTTLRDQLEAFRKRRNHLAVVVDEYGALMGLITLEDILEEIVGQIEDEHDKVIRGVKRQPDGSLIVRGNINIRDLNREIDWDLPTEDDANTLAGFVISLAQRIPELGEEFKYEVYEFTVLGKIRNQITSIRIRENTEDEEMSDVQE